MPEYKEEIFDYGLSGDALLKLMRENNLELSDINITSRHVKYYEDWEEDYIVVQWAVKD